MHFRLCHVAHNEAVDYLDITESVRGRGDVFIGCQPFPVLWAFGTHVFMLPHSARGWDCARSWSGRERVEQVQPVRGRGGLHAA